MLLFTFLLNYWKRSLILLSSLNDQKISCFWKTNKTMQVEINIHFYEKDHC